MSARILVVDDVPAQRQNCWKPGFSAEYFDVLTASSGAEALQICQRARMRHHPARRHDAGHGRFRGLPPAEVQPPVTHFIPVVMVTALDSPRRPRPRA